MIQFMIVKKLLWFQDGFDQIRPHHTKGNYVHHENNYLHCILMYINENIQNIYLHHIACTLYYRLIIHTYNQSPQN